MEHGRQEGEGVAHAFVAARRKGWALPVYPGCPPQSLKAAYRIQDEAIALTAQPVGGWKVGRINPPLDGVDRLSGPIFADQIVVETPAPSMPVFAAGFGAAEAEFLLRVGTAPDPAKTHYTVSDAAALIDAVHVGIEIASSPFPGINDQGPCVTVSDFGNNNGLVVGPLFLHDVLTTPVELRINGEVAGAASAETMLDGPFGAARFLFENLASRGIAIRPGQWISSGAVTGVHRVRPGDHVEARFGDDLVVTCDIVER
ncbi:2-keto-4-pentenoate hydratase [Sphingomonas spermidinifaciens]|uniref:2-keto-4-pentenoate hydratase n=1 Tax=Sphingomonas spermidinifaciens TaxID=1141889 RepID=A0A2A4B8L4_9SPHN|nr:2-keto-4-pentenoate hydratase [Sphingomonas spermidinifaciens]